MLCVFGPADKEELLRDRLSKLISPELDDLVDLVSIKEPVILNHQSTDELGRIKPRLAALDCGIKFNILRSLCQYFEVIWCPPDTQFDTLVNEYNIDALFCSNGPGDPAHPGKASSAKETLAKAVNQVIQ